MMLWFPCADVAVCTDELKRVWINDSKATNVEATAVALQGLGGRKAVVLLGGVAKVSQWILRS